MRDRKNRRAKNPEEPQKSVITISHLHAAEISDKCMRRNRWGGYVPQYRPIHHPPMHHEKIVKPTIDVYVFQHPLNMFFETSCHF